MKKQKTVGSRQKAENLSADESHPRLSGATSPRSSAASSSRPKTTQQVRAIYGEARRRGLDNETLHELVADVLYGAGSGNSSRVFRGGFGGGRHGSNREASGDASQRTVMAEDPASANVTAAHAVEQTSEIGTQTSDVRPLSSDLGPVSIAKLTYSEAERVIERLKGRSFVPRRTLQYRRQRAGVKQLVTREQEEKIAALASQRRWSAEALASFCKRQCGHYPLRTTIDANKVIEALKDMNEREGLWAA